MKRYYAKVNQYATEISYGFNNAWDVYVFSSKHSRDIFVKNDSRINTKAIGRDAVTAVASNWSCRSNGYIRPEPFTRQYWGINDYTDHLKIDGLIGTVEVCYDGSLQRLFN